MGYIKQYLLDSNLPLITKIKIGLRYYITAQPELIVQFTFFKGYPEKINPFLFFEVLVKIERTTESSNIWVANDLYGEGALPLEN